MKTAYYRIDQALPPRHWHQRRVGWFGKALMAVVVLTFMGASSYGYVMNKQAVKSFAAQTNNPDRLKKVTSTVTPTTAENIIDVQFVLDQWAEKHPGQKWSVVAKSLTGASFDARINANKEYESSSMRKLLIAVPLYAQIPAEHQKSLQVSYEGGQKPMATCVDLMIRLSNDACESVVSNYLDMPKANEELKKAGLHRTSLSQKTAKTTAEDAATYLTYVQNGALQRAAKDTLLQLLKEQQYKNGIPAGCPGCVAANKTNPDESTVHDVAIVSHKGGTYVLAIFTKDGSFEEISQLAGQIQQKILDTSR